MPCRGDNPRPDPAGVGRNYRHVCSRAGFADSGHAMPDR